ncbi:MAG: hypothetical protein ABIG89_05570 [Candidatus Woesearchaeota archaeon]
MKNIFDISKINITKKHIIFLILFAVLVFVGRRINFSHVIGADNQFFTLFQFFGPIAGSFLGPVFGAASVFIAHGTDYIITSKAFTLINIIRLTPMIFAAYYFGVKIKTGKNIFSNFTSYACRGISIFIPLAAMIAFIAHPVGRQVWFFSLFWLIPIVVRLLPAKYSNNLILKSFGATFVAHSVGTAAWIWTIPMSAEAWIALIPIVVFERSLFAFGIIGSYVGMNAVLHKVKDWFSVPEDVLHIDKSYLVSRLFKAKA